MKVDNFRLQLGKKEYIPIVVGGMGVNISTTELALAAERLGGIGHISDAEVCHVCDQLFSTSYTTRKRKKYSYNAGNRDKFDVHFDLGELAEAQKMYVEHTVSQKSGNGAIFMNCMEKLTMRDSSETLQTRLSAAMDAGIDGLTLAAGLNLRTLDLIKDHPRFHDVKIGIIISSLRALNIFLKRAIKLRRIPDYIVVEGPLAGGHLGFGPEDWKSYNLYTIVKEVLDFLKSEDLTIPVIPAGGIFTGTDAVKFLETGASAVQVATRFTITKESGLPYDVKQRYINTEKGDIVVNTVSPTGYPMRMLRSSPVLNYAIKPNCEGFGYLLDNKGRCGYIESFYRALEAGKKGRRMEITDQTCLCTGMAKYDCWTCGDTAWRLKETTNKMAEGSWQLPAAEDIFLDYRFSEDHHIQKPSPEERVNS